MAAFCALMMLILMYIFPLRQSIILGGDEGFEFTKAYLVSLGIDLYDPIWNDQPPLYTEFTAIIFKLIGANATTARSVAVFFGFIYLWTLGSLITMYSNLVTGSIGVVLAILSPQTAMLCVSSMLEIPALACGMTSALILVVCERNCISRYISGMIFGISCHIKLTALMVLPAILLMILNQHIREKHNNKYIVCSMSLFSYIVGMFTSYASIWLCYPNMNFNMLIGTHFSNNVRDSIQVTSEYVFDLAMLWNNHGSTIVASVSGVIILIVYRKSFYIPVTLLLTALFVHSAHVPYWSYYYLHFVAPLCWLSAFGITAWFNGMCMECACRTWKSSAWKKIRVITITILVSWLVVEGANQVIYTVNQALSKDETEERTIIKILKNIDNAEWIYTLKTELAFHAGIKVIPELAIVPAKRYWSGYNNKEKLRYINHYSPELMLLTRMELMDNDINIYLKRYKIIYETESLVLYEIRS